MEHLYLKWVDYKENKKYIIGALFKDKEKGKYYFKLNRKEVEQALNKGIISKAILPFWDFNRIYESDEIFAIFKIRLPKIEKYTKQEFEDLLKELDMEEYDEFEYLIKTKGILMTDKFIVEKEK